MRIWFHVALRIFSDLFSLIIKFAAMIVVIGGTIWLAVKFETFARFLGWTVFGLVAFMVLVLITLYVLEVHDSVKRRLK